MASVMDLHDFYRLMPFFHLRPAASIAALSGEEALFLPAVCPDCGQTFAIELLECEGDILFNFEDLLCPDGCNGLLVGLADFHEQLQFEKVEEFFARPVEEPLRRSLRAMLSIALPATDN